MRIVALLTVRNEELYLVRTLTHLVSQGVDVCIIDNGSTDKTLEIANSFLGKGVFRIEHLSYQGSFELFNILCNEEKLAREIDADWFIHHDADEIREAFSPFRSLYEGILEVDRLGYNAINFDEYVFLPTGLSQSFEKTDFVKTMRYYYYFKPIEFHRINAWKKTQNINLSHSGGHQAKFPGRKVFPRNFILRHYIILSKEHAISKYGVRNYSKKEVAYLGWHRDRVGFEVSHLRLPGKDELIELSSDNNWDTNYPFKKHKFFLEMEQDSKESVNKQKRIMKDFRWIIGKIKKQLILLILHRIRIK